MQFFAKYSPLPIFAMALFHCCTLLLLAVLLHLPRRNSPVFVVGHERLLFCGCFLSLFPALPSLLYHPSLALLGGDSPHLFVSLQLHVSQATCLLVLAFLFSVCPDLCACLPFFFCRSRTPGAEQLIPVALSLRCRLCCIQRSLPSYRDMLGIQCVRPLPLYLRSLHRPLRAQVALSFLARHVLGRTLCLLLALCQALLCSRLHVDLVRCCHLLQFRSPLLFCQRSFACLQRSSLFFFKSSVASVLFLLSDLDIQALKTNLLVVALLAQRLQSLRPRVALVAPPLLAYPCDLRRGRRAHVFSAPLDGQRLGPSGVALGRATRHRHLCAAATSIPRWHRAPRR